MSIPLNWKRRPRYVDTWTARSTTGARFYKVRCEAKLWQLIVFEPGQDRTFAFDERRSERELEQLAELLQDPARRKLWQPMTATKVIEWDPLA